MIIGLIAFFGISFLILAHEAGHFFAARKLGLRVDEFGFGFPPRIASWRRGETDYSINWLPFGGFVRIAGENDSIRESVESPANVLSDRTRLFLFQPTWKRAVVIAAGVMVNFLAGWWLLSVVFMVGTPRAIVVMGVQPGSPAAAAGITSGDVIRGYAAVEEFLAFVDEHRGQEVTLRIGRKGEDKNIVVVPRERIAPNEGPIGVELVGVGTSREPFFSALWSGLREATIISWMTLVSFGQLVRDIVSQGSIPEGVAGPVGIFSLAQETGQLGFIYLVQLLALISLNLTILNILPFPALDGGRLALLAIEKIKGSPVPLRVEAWVNGLGFVVLILLVIGITVRDLSRLF